MTEFREEIRSIAKEREKRRRAEEEEDRFITVGVEMLYEVKEAMERFFSLAEIGVKVYNEGSGERMLSIYELPQELLTIFLNLPGKRMGFCIIGPNRFVVFLDEEPNGVLVLGQKRQTIGVTGQVLIKARQLIKITCLKSGDELMFKDNTGASLNPEDVIKQTIKWVSE